MCRARPPGSGRPWGWDSGPPLPSWRPPHSSLPPLRAPAAPGLAPGTQPDHLCRAVRSPALLFPGFTGVPCADRTHGGPQRLGRGFLTHCSTPCTRQTRPELPSSLCVGPGPEAPSSGADKLRASQLPWPVQACAHHPSALQGVTRGPRTCSPPQGVGFWEKHLFLSPRRRSGFSRPLLLSPGLRHAGLPQLLALGFVPD